MDSYPVEVLIHNTIVGMKGEEGTLLQIGDGYYELNCRFGGSIHRILLPIQHTVLIAKQQEERFATDFEIER
jgi:hypothetical protein